MRFVWWWETAAPFGTNAWNWEATFRLFSINMLSLSLPQWWDELCWDTFSFRFSGFGTLVLSAAAFSSFLVSHLSQFSFQWHETIFHSHIVPFWQMPFVSYFYAQGVFQCWFLTSEPFDKTRESMLVKSERWSEVCILCFLFTWCWCVSVMLSERS